MFRGIPGYSLGFVAALTQLGIMIVMLLSLEHADKETVVGVNGCIAAVFAATNALTRKQEKDSEALDAGNMAKPSELADEISSCRTLLTGPGSILGWSDRPFQRIPH